MPPRNAVAAPMPVRQAGPSIQRIVRSKAGKRFVIYGVPGVGKTSLVAGADNALIISVGNETGYQTLVDSGLAAERDYAHIESWADFDALLRALIDSDHVYQCVAIDALTGLGLMSEDHAEAMKSPGENFWHKLDSMWIDALGHLDAIRERGTHVVFLAHAGLELFKNPLGDDYHGYQVACMRRAWPMVEKWADAILFYTFQIEVKNEGASSSKARKGIGGKTRVLRCSNHAAWTAKQRLGLADELIVPSEPSGVWDWLMAHISAGAGKDLVG